MIFSIAIVRGTELIKEVRLCNARVFKDRVWRFPLAQLNAFCGTNSAGKSTVLKSIQLLRQNMVPRVSSSGSQFKLKFSGQHIDLGNFTSFVSHEQTHRELLIGISIETALSSNSYSQLERVLGPREESGELFRYEVDCDFKFGAPRQQVEPKQIVEREAGSEEEVGTVGQEAFLKEALFQFRSKDQENPIFKFSLSRYELPEAGGPAYYLELPREHFGSEELYSSTDQSLAASDTLRIQTSLRSLLPDRLLSRIKQTQADGTEVYVTRGIPLPEIIEEVFGDIRIALNGVVYLGPLRAPAKRYYTGQPDYNLASDTTGESLPYLIRDRIESIVYYRSPDTSTMVKEPLGEALNYWLYYLRTGMSPDALARANKEITIDTLEEILVQLDIMSPDGKEVHALADSGFGYSQFLPIIARGLLMGLTGTMVVEQPEVHLNPALQIRISEFFIALALTGKQVIVETHSEHIVNYLRVRAAEDISGTVSKTSMILYIDSAQGLPNVHQLCVKDDGSIPDWPTGFFGEAATLSARILRAQRLHRAKERTI